MGKYDLFYMSGNGCPENASKLIIIRNRKDRSHNPKFRKHGTDIEFIKSIE
jgi:hypothetical protein